MFMYYYTLGLLQAFNGSFTLDTHYPNSTMSWSLLGSNRAVSPPSSSALQSTIRVRIFDVFNSTLRTDEVIQKRFVCLPNDHLCNSVMVPLLNWDSIGTYRTLSRDSDENVHNLEYHVLAYAPIEFGCAASSSSKCQYESDKHIFNVTDNSIVKVTCSVIIVAQSSVFDVPATLGISLTKQNGDEEMCSKVDTTVMQLWSPSSKSHQQHHLPEWLASIEMNKTNNSFSVFKLSTSCSHYYTMRQSGSTLSCALASELASNTTTTMRDLFKRTQQPFKPLTSKLHVNEEPLYNFFLQFLIPFVIWLFFMFRR